MTPGTAGNDLLVSIKRTLRVLVVSTLVLFGGLLFVGYRGYVSSERNETALCTFRGDLASRVTSSEKFLLKHPQGFAGITAAQIQVSLDNQRRTVYALRDLNC